MVVRRNRCGCGEAPSAPVPGELAAFVLPTSPGREPHLRGTPHRLGFAGGPVSPLSIPVSGGPRPPRSLKDLVPPMRSGPTFEGFAFTHWRAQALAECEGDTLIGWGGVPAGYAEEGTSSPWWTVTGYVPGWVCLLVARGSGFRLYILNGEKVAVRGGKTPLASYCGYRIVTLVEGEQVRTEWECWYFDYVAIEFTWRIVVQRVRAGTGALEEVVRERFTVSALLENRDHSARVEAEMYYYVAVGACTVGEGGLVRSRYTRGGGVAGVLFIVRFDGTCEAAASAASYAFAFALGVLRECTLVTQADDSGAYLGDEHANVAHALRLVENHKEAWEQAELRLEDFCKVLPKRCGEGGPKHDLPDPDDDTRTVEAP